MHKIFVALLLAASLPRLAAAQPQPQPIHGDTTAYRHDRGFLLRLDLGVGYMKSSIDASPSLGIKGAGPEFGLLLGGPIAENLVIGGHLWIVGSISPTLEQGSLSASTNTDTSNTLVALGPNITYYLMPANAYLSVSPSITRLSITTGQSTGTSDAGFGMQLAVGKEWWVSGNWGLGLAGQFMFSTNNDRDGGPQITTLAGALAMSATFN
jgi:hypothetical protein